MHCDYEKKSTQSGIFIFYSQTRDILLLSSDISVRLNLNLNHCSKGHAPHF